MTESFVKPETTPKSQNSQTTGNLFRRLFAIPEVGVLLPLVGFVIIFYMINPAFLNPDNIAAMVRAMSFIGVIALGQTLFNDLGCLRSIGRFCGRIGCDRL